MDRKKIDLNNLSAPSKPKTKPKKKTSKPKEKKIMVKILSKNDILKILAKDTNNPIASYRLKAERIRKRITGSKGSKHNNDYQFRIIEDVVEMMMENFKITTKK
jgi:hypothetical protein